jgi:probable F420-dependent oxidoreductase
MSDRAFRIGAVFPQIDIGTDPADIRRFAQQVEALGFSHLLVYDHVVGADITHRPEWKSPYIASTTFQEPMVLLAYLAAVTKTMGLATGVIILPQRQTVLFAKQAANIDIFSNGRLRLGIGLGWNKVEYDALGMSFERRGRQIEEQIPLLRRLWTQASFSDHGQTHNIVEAGICPLPLQRPIPLWIGGFSEHAMKRAARIGDGWLPFLPTSKAAAKVNEFREAVVAAGRDPNAVPLENIVFFAPYGGRQKTLDKVIEDVETWRRAGIAAVSIETMNMGVKGVDAHLSLFEQVAKRLALC